MEKYDAIILNLDGSKKFFEIGSFSAFIENDITFEAICAGGLGVINASFLAMQDIDNMVKFWTLAINTDLFKVIELIANIYETTWSTLNDRQFIKEFTKFLATDERLNDLKNSLKKYIKENKVRNSNTTLFLNSINLSTLDYEVININEIPLGQFHSYILLLICFPEISRFKKKNSLVINTHADLINILVDNGYQNILSSEETIEPLSFRNINIIKSSDFLEIESSYNSAKMKKHINTGYLDTLKAINKVSGKIYYIDYINDEEYDKFTLHLGEKLSRSKNYLIKILLEANHLNKQIILEKLDNLIKYSEFRKEKNLELSLIENLGNILGIEKNKKYTFTEFKNVIEDIVKRQTAIQIKKVQDKEVLSRLIKRNEDLVSIDKETFMEYFLILISAKPQNYAKLSIVFNKINNKMLLGIVTLIYLFN
ncbi:hypothetical protein ANASTE_02308 [Anaerofustis stercorihominis DSM 17244]|uniref:PNPLA domain-containing protein n=1 Tax=Anaerofustis stercorihominis DSM 17244 TaxID=445971 RepID=B1C9K8_9FIRM|nr:hypothetical protein [Anaerofustis stercorihominis]EDS72579.1 hypothetical protein ANASTE_02308 [Anaerofustis stercorihominis DSM 17244]